MSHRAARLILLAKVLEGIPLEQFIISWEIPIIPSPKTKRGCALGWALHIPQFRRDGLTDGGGVIQYQSHRGLEAACEFFDVTPTEAWALFTPTGYIDAPAITPAVVAAKLQAHARKAKPAS